MPGIRIGFREFKSKKFAKEFVRVIVATYENGQLISPGHFQFIRDLLDLHPESEAKVGCGILGITVDRNPVYPSTRGFILYRHDGTSTDFSWLACIDGRTRQQDVMSAMRFEIAKQVITFKSVELIAGGMVCPYRGIKLDMTNSHVDHEPPMTFSALVELWLSMRDMTIDDVAISDSADNQYISRMTDIDQLESWVEFHADNANLRLLSRTANLSDVKRHG